jgi:hypothetical protein
MAVEKSTEVMIEMQKVRRDITKLKDIIDAIVEEAKEDPGAEAEVERTRSEEREDREEARDLERRRKQAKFTKRLTPILRLLPEQMILEHFGSGSHEGIWEALNTSAGHRTRVIEWLEAILTTQVSGEIKEMNKKASALKIQESYRTSKGITMRRYIDKERSPQCEIEWKRLQNMLQKHGRDQSKTLSKRTKAQDFTWKQESQKKKMMNYKG